MTQMHLNRMTDPILIEDFCLAGNARLTLVSTETGIRFTYRIRASKDGRVHFVSLMTGPDNESMFSYMGIIRTKEFSRTAKSRITEGATSLTAFDWFWNKLQHGKVTPTLEVWHEGRCGRCNRTLTVPASIESGIGPECAKHVARGNQHELTV